MALNLDLIGKKIGPVPFTYGPDTAILYALGIGAGVEELDFVYEKNLKVFPTFAVVPFVPSFLSSFVPESKVNLYAVLHGEQKIILHRPIPVSGTIYTTTICDSIYDKGDKGAVLNLNFETRDASDEILFENKAVIVDRSGGNFGGERGPRSEKCTSRSKGRVQIFTWNMPRRRISVHCTGSAGIRILFTLTLTLPKKVDSSDPSFRACAHLASPEGLSCTVFVEVILHASGRFRSGS